MKKFIAVVLLVIMCVPLAGCSMFFRPQTVSEDEVPLVSDETHYVIFSDGAFVSYEHEGNEITGCLAYIDCQTPEQAVEAVKSYKETEEMDENLRTVIVDNFEAAVEISKSIDETKAFLLHENLTERFEKEGFSVSEKTNSDIITGRGLDYNVTFSDLSKRYEIELGFDHYYFWGSRTLIRFLDLNVDKGNLEKITHEYQESGWRIEKTQGLLVLGNHHNKITLDDSFFYALANNDLEKRDDAIRDILRQYVNQKNEAVTMANNILDLLKGNGPLTKNAEGVGK